MTERRPANPLLQQAAELAQDKARRELLAPAVSNLTADLTRVFNRTFRDAERPEGIGYIVQVITADVDVSENETTSVSLERRKKFEGEDFSIDISLLGEKLVLIGEGLAESASVYIESKDRDVSKPIVVGGLVPHAKEKVTAEDIKKYKQVLEAFKKSKSEKNTRQFRVNPFRY